MTTLTGIIVPSAWKICVMPTLRPISPIVIGSHLDFDVDARSKRESHQGVDRLRGGLQDVDEPLMRADLELFPAVLVDEGRPQDGEFLDARRQRNGTDDIRAGPLSRLHDLRRRLIKQSMVVCLEADSDPLPCHRRLRLLGDRGDGPGADSAATLADGEALADFEGDRGDELDRHVDVVAGHDHLGSIGQSDGSGDVGRAQVELGPVAVVEGGVAATLLAGENVHASHELGVRLDRSGLGEDLAPLDVVTLDAAQEAADVVAGATLVEQLLEHLDTGHDDLAGGPDADDLDLVGDLDDATLDAAGGDGATALDAEDVFDRHDEGLVDRALRSRDVGVDRIHELLDADVGGIVDAAGGLEGLQRGAADDRDVVAWEVVLGEQLTDF